MLESATTLFALLKNQRGNTEVKRMPLSDEALTQIRTDFSRLFVEYDKKTEIAFDNNYQINQDDGINEILLISNFPNLPTSDNGNTDDEQNTNAIVLRQVTDALNNAASTPDFVSGTDIISALFMGEILQENNIPHIRIAFQKFQKSQYIARGKHLFVFRDNVYQNAGENGISIPSEYLTAIYNNGSLKFISSFYANQIFSLVEYFKVATQEEVDQFANMDCIDISDANIFNKNVEVKWYRKRIAFIRENGILQHNTPVDIKIAGQDLGIEIEVVNNKIVLPNEKTKLKELFAFLAEDTYKGVFTKKIYNTNSKISASTTTSVSNTKVQ